MREIVLDTETTGMDPAKGDRIVEIGCLELINYMPTQKTFWHYINPERDIPLEAQAVHGISNEMVKDKPTFIEIVGDFLDFIGDDTLIIHNAEFDLKFLNHHLKEGGYAAISNRRVVDTLMLARQKFPGQSASLDALCRRFGIDLSARADYHGALLDSRLLADVYLELKGGRQQGLALDTATATSSPILDTAHVDTAPQQKRKHRKFPAKKAEIEAHGDMVKKLKNALWSA
ncbi:MAG: DNA polymerase III subunit epsilon [Alphaproteobacteria bacterium]|nr:DNA polymerase III subunit epsilon [Alphaproteobacteria bacterium]